MEILSLGEKIKRRRKEMNLTLKDVAGDRITPGQISLVESGKSNPSMDLLEYLANSLNTSIEYLMESEETQAEKICIYYENMAESYILNGDLYNGEQYLEKSLYYAEKYNIEHRKAKNLYLRGIIYIRRNEFAMAQQLFLSANVIFIKNNSSEEIVKTFLQLGRISLDLKAYYSACSNFQQSEKAYLDNDIGDDFLLGEIYYYISLTHSKLENVDKAISYAYLSKEKFNKLNNKKEYAKSLLLLSNEYSEKGDLDNAMKYSKKTLNVFKEINDEKYVSEIENNLGKLFYEFGNIEEAFRHLNKAKDIRKRNKDDSLIDTLNNLCENYIRLKDIESSKNVLEEISIFCETSKPENTMIYYLLKYRIHMLEGNSSEAEGTLLLALSYAENMDLLREAGEIAILIGKFYMDLGNEAEAAKYLSKGVDIFKKVGIIKDI